MARSGYLPVYRSAEVKRAWLDQPDKPGPELAAFFDTPLADAPMGSVEAIKKWQANTKGQDKAVREALSGKKSVEDAIADWLPSSQQ